jgi:hypothetical protein
MPVEGTLVPSLGALRTTLLIAAGCAVLALVASLWVPSLPESGRETEEADQTGPEDDDAPAPALLRGRVLHDHGAPAAGARVTLVDVDGRQLSVSPVDPDGVFAADPGAHRAVMLIAGLAGAHPTAVHVVPGQDTLDRPVVLSPTER